MEVADVLARNIKQLRKSQKMSQAALGKRAGLGQTTISAMERPEANKSPSIDTVDAVARALGVPSWLLLFGNLDDIVAHGRQIVNAATIYAHLDDEAKTHVDRVAETEQRYQAIREKEAG